MTSPPSDRARRHRPRHLAMVVLGSAALLIAGGAAPNDVEEARAGLAARVAGMEPIDQLAPLAECPVVERGAVVADVGCGYGHSTIALAKAFPASTIYGFDNHPPSIAACRDSAAAAGVADRTRFAVKGASEFADRTFDVIAYFNCLHDLGRPGESLAHARAAIEPDGILLVTEPMAGHSVEENFTPIGRVMSGSSVLCCTPHGIADGGQEMGTLVTDQRLAEVAIAAGFRDFRRVYENKSTRVFRGSP